MTNVSIARVGSTFTADIVGHAGYAERGIDIVCAACSVLAQSAAEALHSLNRTGGMEDVTVYMSPGKIFITATAKAESVDEVRGIFHMLRTGYQLLSESYPDYVQIKAVQLAAHESSVIGEKTEAV